MPADTSFAWPQAFCQIVTRSMQTLGEASRADIYRALANGARLRFVTEGDANDIVAAHLDLVESDGVCVRLIEIDIRLCDEERSDG